MTKETVSKVSATLRRTEKGWEATATTDTGKKSVFEASTPAVAFFGAIAYVGLADKGHWVHPDPFVRLNNAMDRAIIVIGSDE